MKKFEEGEKLWDIEHPYYCCEGNYFKNECFHEYESWDAFISDMGDADEDMNLLWRWDWGFDEEKNKPSEYISLFYMMQRKGFNQSWQVKVSPSDHDRIALFLKTKAKRIKEIWYPFLQGLE